MIDIEHLMTRGRVRGALAAFVVLALVTATSCATKQRETRLALNDSAIGPPARLRFKTVRSILEDSKGNYGMACSSSTERRSTGFTDTVCSRRPGRP